MRAGLYELPRYATFTMVFFYTMGILSSGLVTFYLIDARPQWYSNQVWLQSWGHASPYSSFNQVPCLLLGPGAGRLRVLLLPRTTGTLLSSHVASCSGLYCERPRPSGPVTLLDPFCAYAPAVDLIRPCGPWRPGTLTSSRFSVMCRKRFHGTAHHPGWRLTTLLWSA